jgi:CHASE1-domain containing sensor protein
VRPLHYIIEYTEPLKGNENAFGLDLSALPPHLKALELGRDSGEIVATERITLVQDASGEPGFVARAPVYRNDMPLETTAQRREALVGFVAIVFRVNTLMREMIDPALLEHLHVRIEDAGLQNGRPPGPGDDTLLYDSDGRVEPRSAPKWCRA